MRVLAISPTAGLAGIDQTFRALCLGLAEKGHHLVAVLPPEAKIAPQLNFGGVQVTRSSYLRWWFNPGFSDDNISYCLDRSRESIDFLVRLIRRTNPDVIVSNTSVFLDGYFAARITGRPHVAHIHALFVDNIYTAMSGEFKESIYRLLASGGGHIVVPAQSLRESLSELGLGGSISVVHNGVDIKRFSPSVARRGADGMFRILQLGHFNDNKNQMMLPDVAMDMLRRGCAGFQFALVGPSEPQYYDALHEKIMRNDLAKYFDLRKQVDDPLDCLGSSDIYVNTSTTETFPVSLLEAQACGLPVVATPTIGAREIIRDGEDGCLVSSASEMAAKLCELMSDAPKLAEMGKRARANIEARFSSRVYVDEFEKVLERAATQSQQPDDRWMREVFFRVPSRRERVRVAVIVPDRSQTSFALLVEKPFDQLRREDKGFEYTVYDLSELHKIKLEEVELVYVLRIYTAPVIEIVRGAKALGIPVAFETDDNYFALQFHNGEPSHGQFENQDLADLISLADRTAVYSAAMRDAAVEHSDRVEVFRPYQLLPAEKPRYKATSVIGFMGSLKKDVDFEFVIPALQRILAEDTNVSLEFFGFVPAEFERNERVVSHPFNPDYDQFISFFRSRQWAVALAPLADTEFNRSKTNNKYREYAAAGFPGVYSDVETYRNYVKHEVTGCLAPNDEEGWYRAIRTLLYKEDLATRIVSAAYEDIARSFSFEDHCINKKGLIYQLVDDRRARADIRSMSQKTVWSVPTPLNLRSSLDLNGKDFVAAAFSGLAGMVAGVSTIPMMDFADGDGVIGAEIVVNNEIAAQSVIPLNHVKNRSFLRLSFGKRIEVEGTDNVEIRIFTRGATSHISLAGAARLSGIRRRIVPAIGLELSDEC
ncbi:glycosyltransferase [Cupriavidus sp. IK-TO18]|uniref:glycosyltransferase family 4 protein n=1 Tax=Cupriavidus sp. IK-TO18 TaxID=2782182 RepID=UPI001896F5EF|nr:glycosyltransferase [Cupriavidus sp. IK-TO18]MBF6986684.1 glycosyltransferase [Cupriavidus sp. IK-TO18]